MFKRPRERTVSQGGGLGGGCVWHGLGHRGGGFVDVSGPWIETASKARVRCVDGWARRDTRGTRGVRIQADETRRGAAQTGRTHVHVQAWRTRRRRTRVEGRHLRGERTGTNESDDAGVSTGDASAARKRTTTNGSTSTRAKESDAFVSNVLPGATNPRPKSQRHVRSHVTIRVHAHVHAPQGACAHPLVRLTTRSIVQHEDTIVRVLLPPAASACIRTCCVLASALAPSAPFVCACSPTHDACGGRRRSDGSCTHDGARRNAPGMELDPLTWTADVQLAKRRERFGDGAANEETWRRRGSRMAWRGGKITSNRDEALKKFVARKEKNGEQVDVKAVRAALERKGHAKVQIDARNTVAVRDTKEIVRADGADGGTSDVDSTEPPPHVHASESKDRTRLEPTSARNQRKDVDLSSCRSQASKKNRRRAEKRSKKRTESHET